MKHIVHMLIGCVLPLLIVFLLPLLGFGEGIAMYTFITFMLVCHLLAMRCWEHESRTSSADYEDGENDHAHT